MRYMYRSLGALLLLLTSCGIFTIAAQGNDVPYSLVRFAENELTALGRQPQIVSAVARQNERNLTLNQIKDTDTRWRNTDGIDRFMLDLMSNDLALVLHNFEHSHGYIVETFVMDNKGANVAQTARTSDYWQGDEAKFTESYGNGRGAVHYGDVEYDASVDEIVIQISIPVMDGERAVGAVTCAVSLDKWERR